MRPPSHHFYYLLSILYYLQRPRVACAIIAPWGFREWCRRREPPLPVADAGGIHRKRSPKFAFPLRGRWQGETLTDEVFGLNKARKEPKNIPPHPPQAVPLLLKEKAVAVATKTLARVAAHPCKGKILFSLYCSGSLKEAIKSTKRFYNKERFNINEKFCKTMYVT